MNKESAIIKKSKKSGFEKVKEFLPSNYIKLIHKQINGVISERMILYILEGKSQDKHGVFDVAINIAFDEKKKMDAISRRISKLTK